MQKNRRKRWREKVAADVLILGAFLALVWAFLPVGELFHSWRPVNAALGDGEWMAVIGDSSVTGAAAQRDLMATWSSLAGVAADLVLRPRNEIHPAPALGEYLDPQHYNLAPPGRVTRVFYSAAEEQGRWLPLLNLKAKAQQRLDLEEYTFGYIIGRRFGIDPERIVIAGEDGARLETMALQFRRVLDIGVTTLPRLVLVSFVANDYCDPAEFNRSPADHAEVFRAVLRRQLEAVENLPAHKSGTRIVALAPLDIDNILSSAGLRSQKVRLDVQLTECGSVRDPELPASFLARPLQAILRNECPALFDPQVKLEERLRRVRDLQAAEIRVWQEEVIRFNARAAGGLKLVFATSVRDASFQPGDLANDCFHPSVAGHTRIANKLLTHELRLDVSLNP